MARDPQPSTLSPAPPRPVGPLRRAAGVAALAAARALVGPRFRRALREMREAEWRPEGELRGRTEAKLAPLLAQAARHVPHYRDLYAARGWPPDALRTLADLARLPVMDKAAFRDAPPSRFLADNAPAHRRVERTTSGSTGVPFRHYLDRDAMPVVYASHAFYDSWFGLTPLDRYVRITVPHAAPVGPSPDAPAVARWRSGFLRRLQGAYEARTQRFIEVGAVDAAHAEGLFRRIDAFRPAFLLGYTSTLAVLADEMVRRGLSLTRPLRGVITIAETLSPPRQRLIEACFGAPIINRYGLREFGSWSAQSCEEGPHRFHVNTELVACEVLRDDGEPCAPGETGRVVLTDLYNYAMPLIRYDTGDLAEVASGCCACGRGFPLLGPIQGRSAEAIRTPAGRLLTAVALGYHLRTSAPPFLFRDHLDAIRHYQFIQEEAGRVRVLVVPTDAFDDGRRGRLSQDLGRLFGEGVALSVEAVSEIPPERSGKRPMVKVMPAARGASADAAVPARATTPDEAGVSA